MWPSSWLDLLADTNTGLTDLRLSSNKMAIEGSPWLGQILKYCQCLVHLDIAGNDVDEVSCASIRTLKCSLAHMHILVIFWCAYMSEALSALCSKFGLRVYVYLVLPIGLCVLGSC